jgi:hypothetical protein
MTPTKIFFWILVITQTLSLSSSEIVVVPSNGVDQVQIACLVREDSCIQTPGLPQYVHGDYHTSSMHSSPYIQCWCNWS